MKWSNIMAIIYMLIAFAVYGFTPAKDGAFLFMLASIACAAMDES